MPTEAPRFPQEPLASPGVPSAASQESERRFLGRIRALAKQHGWLFWHCHDSRKSDPGYPDMIATDGTRLVIAELKSATGKLTKEQAQWLALLQHTGTCDVFVWRPSDWPAIYHYFTNATSSSIESAEVLEVTP